MCTSDKTEIHSKGLTVRNQKYKREIKAKDFALDFDFAFSIFSIPKKECKKIVREFKSPCYNYPAETEMTMT